MAVTSDTECENFEEQKSFNRDVKTVVNSSAGTAVWGLITGTLSAQTDLQTALNAKLTNSISTNKLWGRGTSGTGPIEEITLGTNLSLTGTTLNASGGSGISELTGDVTAGPGSGSQAATIANDAVTTVKILNSNVTLAKIANIADATILGNNTGGAAAPIALTASQAKTVLALNLVENTTLSTWAGTANITTLGTISTGTWSATAIALNKITALTTSRAVVSDGSGFLASATTTATEIGYVNGVTSSIQTQINAITPFTDEAAQDAVGTILTDTATIDLVYTDATPKIEANVLTVPVVDESSDTSCFIAFFTAATGNLVPKTNSGIGFNSATGILSATGFSGPLTGNVTGNVTGAVTGNADTATLASTVTVANEGTDTTCFISFFTAVSGSLAPKTNTSLPFNSATGVLTLTSPIFVTPALGTPASGIATNLTGTASGLTAGNVTTNANLTGPITSVGNATTIANSIALPASPTTTTQAPADNSTKIATTAYVDNAVLGQNFKEACKYATTAALPSVVYANGSSGVGATLTGVALAAISTDGSSPSVADRIAVKNQASTFQNGLYSVTATGSGIAVFVLTRTTDSDQATDYKTGDSVFITGGNTQASTTWAYTGIDTPTIGTDAITFVQAAGPGSYTQGNGITITGTSIAIDTSVTVDKTTAQTLTNKTLTSPKLNENVAVTATATQVNYLASATGTTGTTSTNIVYSTSPTLVTPVLGVATATSINKVEITQPATSATLTIVNGKTLTASNDADVSGTNTGDETAARIGALINGSAAATPNDADLIGTSDTSVLKKLSWTNAKAFLKTYFDTLYQTLAAKNASGGYPGLNLFKIEFKNAANTFTNFFTNATTAARTYTFPDKDITVAGLVDITGINSGTNTGDQTISDATITTTDITTNNFTTAKHGFVPKGTNVGNYLKDDGTWASVTATDATNAVNTGITNDTTTNATMFLTWVTANTGNLPQKVSSTKLTFNPSTGVFATTTFSGAGTSLTGTGASFTAGLATDTVTKSGTGSTYTTTASPAFTGTPTAPTAASGTNTTQIATTAFVQGEKEPSSIPCGTVTQDIAIYSDDLKQIAVGNGTTVTIYSGLHYNVTTTPKYLNGVQQQKLLTAFIASATVSGSIIRDGYIYTLVVRNSVSSGIWRCLLTNDISVTGNWTQLTISGTALGITNADQLIGYDETGSRFWIIKGSGFVPYTLSGTTLTSGTTVTVTGSFYNSSRVNNNGIYNNFSSTPQVRLSNFSGTLDVNKQIGTGTVAMFALPNSLYYPSAAGSLVKIGF